MPILESENSKKRKELKKIKEYLKDILNTEFISDYTKYKEYTEQAYSELNTFKLEERKLLNLTGRIYSVNEIIEMIKKASGCNNWGIYEENIISLGEIEYIKNTFEVDFETDIIKNYVIGRDSGNRNEVFLIDVIALPGLFNVDYQTGRAICSIQGLVNEKEMIEELQKIF